jgi:group I intron endonuclease
MSKIGRIYLITNILTEDTYVGKTYKSLKERFSGHVSSSKRNSKTHLHRAIRKYGKENFIIEEIEKCEENLGSREMFWISKLMPKYNQTLGGDGGMLGFKHSEETKNLLSKRRLGKCTGKENHFYGKTHTEEQKEKWSKMRKGQPSPCGFSGKTHTQESKNKTSQSLKNNPNLKRIKVFQYDIEGNFLREFESITEAAKFVSTNPSNIKYTCEGKFNHCKGYKWSYNKIIKEG